MRDFDVADLTSHIQVVDPVTYLDFLRLEADATVVLTDSGGIQEETTVLGVPCLTLRENTERPITISEGTNQLVGFDGDRIRAAVAALGTRCPPRRPALWDGHTADRVAGILAEGTPAVRWRSGPGALVDEQ